MEKHKIAIIIPAYNESATIEKVIKSIIKFGKVIVIDDASTDDTGKIAKKSGAIVIKNKRNMEYDFSLGKGISNAINKKFIFAITFDADGQHLAKDIPQVIQSLKQGYDLVLGIRDTIPRISEKLSIIILNLFYNIRDPYCGLKAYKLSQLKKRNFITYKSTGTEIAFYLMKKGCKYKQIEISTKSRRDKPRFGNKVFSNYKILKSTFLSLKFLFLKNL
tara:strand:- start:699 stop:1355 length:657 start_codon:yes stop_codon:yes gene_type:complete